MENLIKNIKQAEKQADDLVNEAINKLNKEKEALINKNKVEIEEYKKNFNIRKKKITEEAKIEAQKIVDEEKEKNKLEIEKIKKHFDENIDQAINVILKKVMD